MSRQGEIPVEELENELEEVASRRNLLQAVGLVLPDSLYPPRDLRLDDPRVRPVIETYIGDTKREYVVLEDLRARLALFTDFLNRHYKGKVVTPDAKTGFEIVLRDTRDLLAPSDLSSGEQQILVLAYEVLFRAQPRTLVLIDEPELSLHVLWQDTFVDDLALMGRAQNLQFLLATHSPDTGGWPRTSSTFAGQGLNPPVDVGLRFG